MRRFLFIVGLIVGITALFSLSFRMFKNKVVTDLNQASNAVNESVSPTPTPIFTSTNEYSTALFVPYWALDHNGALSEYEELIYFGVTPTQDGIDTEEAGYANIDQFISKVEGSDAKVYLTLRMLDREENFSIIENPGSRQKVIRETIALAKAYEFDGIVLDLEVNAIPFDSVIQNISTFVTLFAKETKSDGLGFQVAIYGDTFYRLRPFDVKKIGANADKVLIMAYDFHKARGNPGPNFPLQDNGTYGYDMTKLLTDFSQHVPLDKLSVIFGMFGYDWEIDEKGKAVKTGEAIGYVDIKAKFIDTCEFIVCEWKRDETSGEIVVKYTDDENTKHVIWFEDPQSARIKQDFLKARGIASFAYWAYSYF